MSSEEVIDVAQLRVGMFIHLDVGWMRHPFPLSSFRITSEDQLVIIRRLGLKQVRWSPAKSLLEDEPAPVASQETVTELDPAAAAAERVAQARREALRKEREQLALCEAQYKEAAEALGQLTGLVLKDPRSAGQMAQELTRSLLNKMLLSQELNLRILNEAAGDRATAHALNVTLVSLLLARACGMGGEEMLALGTGALLHDLGKIEVDARYRHRGEQFNPHELQAYQDHVAKGVRMAQQMMVGPDALAVIAQHHEHADATGFPQRLSGERMNPLARIVALVNRFDGLCNPAVASKGLTPHEALSLMFAQGRSRFDATLLNAFIRMMGVYPPGSIVQLTDERFAIVVAVNSSRPLKPRVMVYEPSVPADEALSLDLEETPTLGIRRSLRSVDLPRPATFYLRPRARFAYFFHGAESAPPPGA